MPVSFGTLHGLKLYNVGGPGWRLREFVAGLTDRLSDVTSTVCTAAARHYLSSHAVSRRRLRLIPNGIDTAIFQTAANLRARLRERLAIPHLFNLLRVRPLHPSSDSRPLRRPVLHLL